MERRFFSDSQLTFGPPTFSFRGFRRDYDDSDEDGHHDHHHPHHHPQQNGHDDRSSNRNHNSIRGDSAEDHDGPAAAAAFYAACPPDEDFPPLVGREERGLEADSEEEDLGYDVGSKVRKRRFYSCSSSSQSPFRSCKSSMSPEHSQDEFHDARDSSVDHDPRPSSSRLVSRQQKGTAKRADSLDDDDDDDEDSSDGDEDKDDCRRKGDTIRRRDYLPVTESSAAAYGRIRNVLDKEDDDEYEAEGWKDLPVILLEDIFVLLSPKQRHLASTVCRPWHEIFYSPRVWETFILFERTLTRKRYNLYKGYQRELCPRKAQMCFLRVGCYFKRIVVTPISDYYNLYEFLRVLAAFLVFYADFPMPLLHTFRFTFACESRGVNGVVIIGTGGNILDKVKELVASMKHLRHLALNQLLLEVEEVPGLLAAAVKLCVDSLHSLELLNCSKVPYPLCEVTQFSQLVMLKLSPQHLSDEVVLLLGGTETLRQLHIVQDAYTCPCLAVSGEAWKLFKEMAPSKRVFLEVYGLTKLPLLLQPHAPVHGVVFRTPYHCLRPELTTWLVEYYGKHLEYFVQETLPRAHGSRKFVERADQCLLRLLRECPRLHTLVVRERLSLATMLLLAQEGQGRLRQLLVRKNALMKRCEWPRARGWSEEYYRWLQRHGRRYDLAYHQMPVILGRRWKPTEDRLWKHMRIHVS